MVEYFKATNKANKLLDKRFVIQQSWQMFLSGTAYKGNFQTSFFKLLELRRDGQFSLYSQLNEYSCPQLHGYRSLEQFCLSPILLTKIALFLLYTPLDLFTQCTVRFIIGIAQDMKWSNQTQLHRDLRVLVFHNIIQNRKWVEEAKSGKEQNENLLEQKTQFNQSPSQFSMWHNVIIKFLHRKRQSKEAMEIKCN